MLGIWVATMSRMGLFVGTGIIMALIAISAIFVWWNSRNQLRKSAADRYEHYFVVEMPNDKEIELRFEDHIYQLAKTGQVSTVAEKLRKMNEESGNKRDLKIFTYRFRDGEKVNETEDEFIEWVTEDISQKRIEQHIGYKKTELKWYMETHLKDELIDLEENNIFEWDNIK